MKQFAVSLFFRKTESLPSVTTTKERMWLKVYVAVSAHEAFGKAYNEITETECKGYDLVYRSIVPVPEIVVNGIDFKGMRIAKGLTLRQVEEKTGISNAYLSQLENGKMKNPSHTIVIKLQSFYNS